MNEQSIKEKIAYAYHELYQGMYEDDPEGDWLFAVNVFNHFQKPISPTDMKWVADNEEYKDYARFF